MTKPTTLLPGVLLTLLLSAGCAVGPESQFDNNYHQSDANSSACVVLCVGRGFHPGRRGDRCRAYGRTRDLVLGGIAEALNVGRKLRCALAIALLDRRTAMRIARPAKHSGH
jgi:hypothetical protein